MTVEQPGTELLVAIDVGTSGARAAALDLDGRRIHEVRRSYPTSSPSEGWAEQDPRAWRSAAISALHGLVADLGGRHRILGIGLTGQCPSVCLVDARRRPIGPGLIYRDNRATEEAEWVRRRLGDEAIHARTGHLPSAFHIGPKLRWLARHEPEAYGAAVRALQPRDLVALELTGVEATDGTHAAATLAYDLRERRWDPDLMEALELRSELFPDIAPSWSVLGGLRPQVAARVGLHPGTPVVIGGADSQACALGSGVVGDGPVSEMAGSSTCLNAAVPEPLPELLVTHYPHVIPGRFTTETGINTTGAAIAWLAGLLYGGRRGRPTARDYAQLDAEVASVAAGSDGVLAVPVLADGERTDPDLRAAFTGLSLRHGRAVLVRSMLEGVACAIRGQLQLLTDAGTPVTELRVSGGDARLTSWTRVKADVLAIPVATIRADAAVTGVGMLAGMGVGVYRDADDANRRCVRIGRTIDPDPIAVTRYGSVYERYRDLVGSRVTHRH